MTTDLQSTLQQLTALPGTEQPFLSIYLDWSTDGSGKRPQLQILEQELDAIAERVRDDTAARTSFEADRERIMRYVNIEAPVDARGLAIFACSAAEVWQALPLQVPVETRVLVAHYPHVFNLARIIDDYETYAVVLADSQEARIFVISLNEAEKAGATEAGEEIRRFQAGGWGQMLFQRRTDNVIRAHHKELADKLGRIIKRYDVQHVIIAGNDSIKGSIRDTLPDQIKNMLVDIINLDITSNMQSIMETIEPMMRDVEREQEQSDIAALQDQLATRGGLGVVGIADTAMALSKGQVLRLLMLGDFNATGGDCPNCGMLRPGMRPTCPYDGAELRSVDLREAFTARAIQQGADVQIIAADDYLGQHEGVGALLRYRDDERSHTVGDGAGQR